MKSPFPGMDPYLEAKWGDVHTRLATYAVDSIQRQLPGDLVASVEEHVSVESAEFDESFEPHGFYPDVRIEELPESSTEVVEAEGEVVVAESIEVSRMIEPFTQRSIRILEPGSKNRIITAIEFLSPANKVGTKGREAYHTKCSELLDARVSLVEIDLIRRGRPILAIPMSAIPFKYRGLYRICIVRGWRLGKAQLYRISLRQQLPVIAIPLRRNDKEVSLDLQQLIDTIYANGRYNRIDYKKDPIPPLPPTEAAWADQLLREKGVRKAPQS